MKSRVSRAVCFLAASLAEAQTQGSSGMMQIEADTAASSLAKSQSENADSETTPLNKEQKAGYLTEKAHL